MAVQKRDAERTQAPDERAELGDLYERDYYAWTDTQVRALRERNLSGLDWENLAEEVEDLGKSERHRLENHLELLQMHLLKWAYRPQRRTRNWSDSIEEHRFRVHRVLLGNPGLKVKLAEIFADTYRAARFSARRETRLELKSLPRIVPVEFR